ncbi:hypothetical protein BN2364_3141 [Alloalcanivorax xenomutans]|nr:hypothetical protein BN2364_3141 [Alloalcanivorax xenomutans]
MGVVETWVKYLARGDYAGAYALTDHDPYYGWTPELIRKVIAGYGLPMEHADGVVYRVTSPGDAVGSPGEKSVERVSGHERLVGFLYYDLPLNGEWSDLTASFRLESVDDTLNIILEEIHVL